VTALRPAAPPAGPSPLADGFGPPAPQRRSRNAAGALLGALLILACASGVAIFTVHSGHRREVLVVARGVAAGSAIQPGDLAETRVGFDPGVHLVAAAERAKVLGRIAAVNLVPGMLVSLDLMTNGSIIVPGHAVVGLALKPGQLPSGVHPLDHVMLIQTSSASTGSTTSGGGSLETTPPASAILVARAQVFAVDVSTDGQTTVVSVIVTTDQAPGLASAAAKGQVSLVLLGESAG
jgi:hypothetical protein